MGTIPENLLSTLLFYADSADITGRNAGVGYTVLMVTAHTNKSKRQVQYNLRALEKLGLLARGDQTYATARFEANRRPVVYDLPAFMAYMDKHPWNRPHSINRAP